MVIFVKAEQLAKASAPIVNKEDGRDILVNSKHSLKALLPIFTIVEGRMIYSKDSQYSNALSVRRLLLQILLHFQIKSRQFSYYYFVLQGVMGLYKIYTV